MANLLHVERRGTTLLLSLNRPPAHALNLDVLREILALLPTLRPPDVRALVITGGGRFFSAGLDLFEVFAYPPEQAATFTRTFDDVFVGLFSLPIPVVAAINGHAVAGGAVLAATADFRLMAEGDGQLGLSEIRVGVPFPTSAFEIVRTAWSGPHFAELIYRGRNHRPAEALARHFVPAAELADRALALADELGSRPTLAFSSSKRALRAEALARIEASQRGGGDAVWAAWRSPEILAAVAAYRQSLDKKRT
jgi:enoyl-CoA hydratase